MNEDKQKLLNFYAERYNEAKRFRLVYPFVSLHIDDLEFLLSLIHDQDKLLTSHAPEGHNYTNKQYVSLLSENVEFRTQLFKCERTIEQLRNENKILIRTIELTTGIGPMFESEREAIATREE